MFLTKIQTFLNNHKKVVLYTTIFCVISFLLSDVALAAWETVAATETVTATETVKDGINSLLEGLNIALSVISVMLALLTYLSTLFLDPSWLNGSVFGLSLKFKEIWILVSNIVYFAFAFILIWIALVNIVWKAGDKFQLKQALPRFIAWILIVPFSWFIVQFILSISAILTVSALTLPINTFPDYNEVMKTVTIPSKCTIDLSHDLDSKTAQNWFNCNDNKNKKWEEGTSRVSLNESFEKWDVNSSIFATISLYTYGVIQIDKLDEFSSSDIKAGVKSSIGFVVKLVIDLLFILVYAILMFALALVLITRWFYIWMYVMLSPIFWLMYFFEKWNWGDWFLWKFSIKEFIALAMVPVYTLLALSFGMLIIYVVWKWLDTSSDGNKWNLEGFSYENDTFSIWNFSLTVKWAVGWSSDKENTKESVYRFMKEWGDWALWAIGVLIMQLFGLAVLWISVMAWMKSSKITAEVIAPLDAFGKQIWGLIAKAPHYAPIFPGGQSMQSINKAWSSVQGHFDTNASWKAAKLLDKTPFWWNAKTQDDLNKIISNARLKSDTSPDRLVNDVREVLAKAWWDVNRLYTEPKFREALFELWNATIWAKDMKGLKLESANSLDSLEKLTWLLSAIDGENKFNNLYAGTTNLAKGDTDQVKELVKELGKKDAAVAVSQENKETSSIKRWSKVAAWENKYVIDFNLNGWNTISGTTWDSWKIEWFRPDDYKDLATYMYQSNVNSIDKMNNMFDSLDISDDSKIRDVIKWQIAKYVTDEGKIDVHQDKWSIDNLNKFFEDKEKKK